MIKPFSLEGQGRPVAGAAVNSRAGAPLYLQLADLLEAAVLDASGQGDRRLRLPPERQLVSMFGVSRTTVRAALGALALRLPLRKRVGAGVFVGPPAVGVAPWSMVRLTPRSLVSPARREEAHPAASSKASLAASSPSRASMASTNRSLRA